MSLPPQARILVSYLSTKYENHIQKLSILKINFHPTYGPSFCKKKSLYFAHMNDLTSFWKISDQYRHWKFSFSVVMTFKEVPILLEKEFSRKDGRKGMKLSPSLPRTVSRFAREGFLNLIFCTEEDIKITLISHIGHSRLNILYIKAKLCLLCLEQVSYLSFHTDHLFCKLYWMTFEQTTMNQFIAKFCPLRKMIQTTIVWFNHRCVRWMAGTGLRLPDLEKNLIFILWHFPSYLK